MKNLKNISRVVSAIVVMMTISLGQVSAQKNDTPSLKVKESLQSNFENATYVVWKKFGPLYYATFSHNKESWIAYLDNSGKLVTSGRRISINSLPIVVQEELKPLLLSYEMKYGSMEPGCIYEMVKTGSTEYFIPFENDNHYLALKSSGNGNIIVAAKGNKPTPIGIENDVMAKK